MPSFSLYIVLGGRAPELIAVLKALNSFPFPLSQSAIRFSLARCQVGLLRHVVLSDESTRISHWRVSCQLTS